MYHTLPVVLQIVLRHPHDFEAAITEAVACGGDTDTVAAIVGGIIGCGVGTAGIPPAWLEGVRTIGVTAGASAPEPLVQGVVERLRELAPQAGVRSQYSDRGKQGESNMLTGDLNAAVVEWVVQYRIVDSYQYLFRVRNVPEAR